MGLRRLFAEELCDEKRLLENENHVLCDDDYGLEKLFRQQ